MVLDQKLNGIINQTYQDFKVNNSDLFTNLVLFITIKFFKLLLDVKILLFKFPKSFFKRRNRKINNFNKSLSTVENIELIKNDMDHNFSNENNIEAANFFKEFQ